MHPPALAHRDQRLRWSFLVALVLAAILLPFAFWAESIEIWSEKALDSVAERPWAVAGTVVALLAGDILLPVPSSVVSTLSGAVLGLVPGAGAIFTGMTLGCGLGYWLGRRAASGAASRLVGPKGLERFEALTRRHGDWSIVVARSVPVLAEASVFFAGLASMRPWRFFVLTSLSNAGLALVYAFVGTMATYSGSFLIGFGGAVSLPALAVLAVRSSRRWSYRSNPVG